MAPSGLNFFDTFPYYGRTLSETRLGSALIGKRHQVVLATKGGALWLGIRALHDLKQQGKVRFIGVTGFPLALLREMVETQDLDVTLSYAHANLMKQTNW